MAAKTLAHIAFVIPGVLTPLWAQAPLSQQQWQPTRTEWGDPDLEGIWLTANTAGLGPAERCISRGVLGSMLPSFDYHGTEIVQAPEWSEYACHEGNYALRNILSAARALERQAR